MKKPRTYPLVIENIGDDTYKVMSKGHHPFDVFMEAAVAAYPRWGLGRPCHTWFRYTPQSDPDGYGEGYYHEAEPHGRGAFPVTFVAEAPPDEHWPVPEPSR